MFIHFRFGDIIPNLLPSSLSRSIWQMDLLHIYYVRAVALVVPHIGARVETFERVSGRKLWSENWLRTGTQSMFEIVDVLCSSYI